MKIGIIVAMQKEMDRLVSLLSDPREESTCAGRVVRGRMGNHEVAIRQCGIGKVNAAVGCVELINTFHPDAVISSGCAGGNGDALQVQDVVVSTEATYHDVYCGTAVDNCTVYGQVQGLPARYAAAPALLEHAKTLSAHLRSLHSSLTLHAGLVVSGDWFVDTKAKMRDIVSHFPEAVAVDMESAAIAQTCYLYKVPFISFRVISDIPLRDTDASQYHEFWDTVADRSFQVTKSFVELIQ